MDKNTKSKISEAEATLQSRINAPNTKDAGTKNEDEDKDQETAQPSAENKGETKCGEGGVIYWFHLRHSRSISFVVRGCCKDTSDISSVTNVEGDCWTHCSGVAPACVGLLHIISHVLGEGRREQEGKREEGRQQWCQPLTRERLWD